MPIKVDSVTAQTTGAMIDSKAHMITFELSPEDFRRFVDFGIRVSGQYLQLTNLMQYETGCQHCGSRNTKPDRVEGWQNCDDCGYTTKVGPQ